MRIIIRPIGEPRDLDVTEWLVGAIAAQLGRCGGAGDSGEKCARERQRRAARKHLCAVIEGFREIAQGAEVQRRIGVVQGDGHEVGSIFAYPDMLGGGPRLAAGNGVAITENTSCGRIRMAPKLTGADERGRILGSRGGADWASGAKAGAP